MVQESCSGYSFAHFFAEGMNAATHGPAALVNRYMLALMLTLVQ